MHKIKFFLLLAVFSLTHGLSPVLAAEDVAKVGVHILSPDELTSAKQLVTVPGQAEAWHYVTIPMTLEDTKHPERWQAFFWQAKQARIIPLVRLVTKVENGAWVVPERKDIVEQINFLAKLEWPTSQRHIIIFNEVNHAKEWGGRIDPEGYARTFRFASSWARSEDKNFIVLPAAMDLAAPTGHGTMEAFTYLNKMHAFDQEIFGYADVWNSHSYANPGFASSPERTGQNSMRGFIHELAYLKEKSGKDFMVYITETGWQNSGSLDRWLSSYYEYAITHIWSHPQVVAVTPFLLKGSPGPFAGFSFLDEANQPTAQYRALQTALEKTSDPADQVSAVVTTP